VVGLQLAVVLLFNVVRKLVHQVRRTRNQAALRRLRAMAQRLLHLCCKPLRVVLLAPPQKECVLQVPVPAAPEVQVRVVLVDQAERRSHRHKCASSHSWVICSSVDLST
jgi:hypothetical protein